MRGNTGASSFFGDGVATSAFLLGEPWGHLSPRMGLLDDGSIVVAGGWAGDPPDRGVAFSQIAMARHNADGRLDETFGTGGIALSPSSDATFAPFDLLVQSDGTVLLAGVRLSWGISSDIALMQFTPSGALDTSFGEAGSVVADGGKAGNKPSGLRSTTDDCSSRAASPTTPSRFSPSTPRAISTRTSVRAE